MGKEGRYGYLEGRKEEMDIWREGLGKGWIMDMEGMNKEGMDMER